MDSFWKAFKPSFFFSVVIAVYCLSTTNSLLNAISVGVILMLIEFVTIVLGETNE